MKEFNKLLDVANTLLSDSGCEWDKKQTFETLKVFLIEEVYELVDAIDEKDTKNILEEIGDVLYILIFITKVAEKNKLFDLPQVLTNISDKMIRRHPHIFAQRQNKTPDEVNKEWEEVKKLEGKDSKRKNLFDEFPKSMPFLLKVQNIIKRLNKRNLIQNKEKFVNHQEMEDEILNLVIKAVNSGFDVESSLKHKVKNLLEQNGINESSDFLEKQTF